MAWNSVHEVTHHLVTEPPRSARQQKTSPLYNPVQYTMNYNQLIVVTVVINELLIHYLIKFRKLIKSPESPAFSFVFVFHPANWSSGNAFSYLHSGGRQFQFRRRHQPSWVTSKNYRTVIWLGHYDFLLDLFWFISHPIIWSSTACYVLTGSTSAHVTMLYFNIRLRMTAATWSTAWNVFARWNTGNVFFYIQVYFAICNDTFSRIVC
jgi:hypothetical protein